MIPFLIVLLAAAGFLIASYFTAVRYRWVEPEAAWVPQFCRLGEETCASIVFTPRAAVFGLPNSVFGQLYYAALLVGSAAGVLGDEPWKWGYLAAAIVTVGLGTFLTHSLLFVTRVPCKLCFASHAVNLALLVLLLAS